MNVKEILGVIEEQEQTLIFDKFGNRDALLLGTQIAEQVKDSERPVAIRIYLGDILVFQYTMRGKEEWHYGWAEKKCRMVMATGHSSLYVMLRHDFGGDWKEWEGDGEKAFACGGFPIQVQGKGMIGVVAASGLVDPQDHVEVVAALSKLLGKTVVNLSEMPLTMFKK